MNKSQNQAAPHTPLITRIYRLLARLVALKARQSLSSRLASLSITRHAPGSLNHQHRTHHRTTTALTNPHEPRRDTQYRHTTLSTTPHQHLSLTQTHTHTKQSSSTPPQLRMIMERVREVQSPLKCYFWPSAIETLAAGPFRIIGLISAQHAFNRSIVSISSESSVSRTPCKPLPSLKPAFNSQLRSSSI